MVLVDFEKKCKECIVVAGCKHDDKCSDIETMIKAYLAVVEVRFNTPGRRTQHIINQCRDYDGCAVCGHNAAWVVNERGPEVVCKNCNVGYYIDNCEKVDMIYLSYQPYKTHVLTITFEEYIQWFATKEFRMDLC